MKTNEIITPCYLRSQSIKLLYGSSGYDFGSVQLSLANGMHDFNPGDRTTRGPERFEPEHRFHHTLHGSMILLNGLLTNDKFCFVRTSQITLRWAHRPRRNSPQAALGEKSYLLETPQSRGGAYEAPVANPPSLSGSRRRSTT